MSSLGEVSHTERGCPACGAPVAASRCKSCGSAVEVGGYVVERVISQNARGRVYSAHGPSGARVVLKELVFRTVPDARQLDAFENEGRVLERLRHPRIPRFLGTLRDGEGVQLRLYLVQQFIDGTTLLKRLSNGTLAEPELRSVAESVLGVLQYLHGPALQLLHRDLKPANLIRDTAANLWVVDFGTARTLEKSETHRGTLVGTFGYAPPEQLGGTLDQTTDLYALGATLIHLASGVAPDTMVDADLRLVFEPYVRVSPQFRLFLRKLTAPRRADRPQSVEEAMALLHAPAPPLWRRQPLRLFAAGLAVLCLVLLAVASPRTETTTPPPTAAETPKVIKRPPVPAMPKSESWNLGKAASDTRQFVRIIARMVTDTGSLKEQCLTDISNFLAVSPPEACGVSQLCGHGVPGYPCWGGPYWQLPIVDPWGHPYTATMEGKVVTVRSAGPDGVAGTEDDLTSDWRGY